eukprot:XP_011618739.1 PREDICTED: olfactory receptor 1D2-like [Takifugu rubripes]
MDNASEVTIFTLSGFNGIVNVTLIVAIIVDKSLHEPMFIFLCNLCINSLYGTAAFYPKFLIDILSTSHVISYVGCLVQSLVVNSSACADFSFLALMAYDRYVAICRPLVYHSVMNPQRMCLLVFAAWILPLGQMLTTIISTSTLRLCGSHISRIYCVNYVILYSYFYIMRTCLTCKEERIKFLQTCLPHLMSCIIVTMCLLFDLLHIRISTERLPDSAQNFIAMQFLLFPPLINPLIYGLKLTKEVVRVLNNFKTKISSMAH